MERNDRRIDDIIRVFTSLIRQSISPSFSISKGGQSLSTLKAWLEAMEKEHGALSKDRIVDYCVCQAHAMSKYVDEEALKRWKTSQAFAVNGKSWQRYKDSDKRVKYYEDKWLSGIGLSRQNLMGLIKDKSKHPLADLIITDYEEQTKNRQLGTDVGYYICEKQTLLYTPFSKSCQQCVLSDMCIQRTKSIYPELYRVRMEAWTKNKSE